MASISDVVKTYTDQLFGSPTLQYNLPPIQAAVLQQAQASTTPTGTQAQWGQGFSGSKTADTREASRSEGNGFGSGMNDIDKWAGQFEPSLTARDVAKAYGKFTRGNPLVGGLAMMAKYANPTRDPLWQKAAGQYLGTLENAPALSDVMKQINQLYNQSLNAKVFASDTAQGALLGYGNPSQWGQAQKYGMQPYEFGQAMQGYNAMGIDPTSANTFEMFGGTTYDKLRDTYGYSNPAQASHLADYARMVANGEVSRDGEVAKSIERGIASAAARDLSNEWMGDILDGKTTLDFDKWKSDREAGGGRNEGWSGGRKDGTDDSDVGNRGFGASGDDYY